VNPTAPVPPPSSDSGDAASLRFLAGLRFALALLYPSWSTSRTVQPAAIRSTAAWITFLGLLVGLAWAASFKAVWRIYGEIGGVRVIPGLAVVLLDCLLVSPVLILGLARTAHQLFSGGRAGAGRELSTPSPTFHSAGTLAMILYVMTLWVLITSIPAASAWWPGPQDWRYPLRHFYPAPIYRPLVLAPLWGYWAMLLSASIGRTAPGADALTVSLCQSLHPGRLLRWTVFPLVMTSIFLSRDGNYLIGAVVGVALFGFLAVACIAMARRGNGQTRDTLGAAGALGQLAFLLLYRAFWPIIHP
jgi:cobalamin synthase